jgi:CheY-like chemotaxis protein
LFERENSVPLKADAPCVLFVDDEPMIRKAGYRILTRVGCRVFLAANGQEALDAYRRQQDEIDVVILDLGMPVMDGHACLSALKQFDPEACVILSSGGNDAARENAADWGADGLLPKPYDAHQLVDIFRKVAAGVSDRISRWSIPC